MYLIYLIYLSITGFTDDVPSLQLDILVAMAMARYEAPGGLGVDCQGLGEDYGHSLTNRRETGIRHCSWEGVEKDGEIGWNWTFIFIFCMML